MKNRDKVSVLIVNWNGKKWIQQCLDSLQSQTHKNIEIIFIDNASSDDSVSFVRANYPDVKLVELFDNTGFAGGNNAGLQHADGEYILLLNNDTIVTETYIEKLLQTFDEIPKLGSVQSKLILMQDHDKLDVCGSYWTNSTFLYHYGFAQNSHDDRFNAKMPFFSNKGASMMLKKSVIEQVGLFDEDFWCYYEETDLCHRIWLAGYQCWYNPSSVAYHAMGGTSLTFHNSYIQFHNFKNKLLSFLKNFEPKTLLWVVPVYLSLNIALSFFWLIQGKWRHFSSLYRAILWNITHITQTLLKRRRIQKMKKCSDAEIFRLVKKNPRLIYYKYLLSGLEEYEE